jgi:DNA-binding transcriptional LysR family regulator
MQPLDLNGLRSFVLAADLGGFARAAAALHRTPGAISLQMKALEERIGRPLFVKTGRSQVLSEAGVLLLHHARRMLQLNDETLAALDGLGLDGSVRFGMPQDFADTWLPLALARFTRAHPAVRIELRVDRNDSLASAVERGQLDLALAFDLGGTDAGPAPPLMRLPMRWIARPDWQPAANEPIPLLLMERPCMFHQAAIDSLDRAGRPWRVVLTSASVSGLWAAAEAGLGVTVRADVAPRRALRVVAPAAKLPRLPQAELRMHMHAHVHRAEPNTAVAKLRGVLDELVRGELGSKAPALTAGS